MDIVGENHVGIGLDYFFEPTVEDGFNDVLQENAHYWPKSQYPDGGLQCARPSQIEEVAAVLLDRGHGEATIAGVLGNNFARVASQVWSN